MVTVKELSELLATMPDDMPVVIYCWNDGGGYDALDGTVEVISVSDTVSAGNSYTGRFVNPEDLNEEARQKYHRMKVVLIS